MPKIFISYRREDSEDITGRIHDRLEPHFGHDNVFLDIDRIPFGVNFRQHLDNAVSQCDILLAVIGEQWLDAQHPEGQRRLDDLGDFVRIEIEAALARDIPVIPVLVGRARMPAQKDLPKGLKPLAFRNAAEVRSGRDFRDHVDRLIRGIEFLFQQGQAKLEEERVRKEKQEQELALFQKEGEEKFANLVTAALDRTGGRPTAEDTAAANQLVRQYRIPSERAKVLVHEMQERWKKAHRQAEEQKLRREREESERRQEAENRLIQLLETSTNLSDPDDAEAYYFARDHGISEERFLQLKQQIITRKAETDRQQEQKEEEEEKQRQQTEADNRSAENILMLCPSCQKMLEVPNQYAGQQVRCPLCNNVFTVPEQ
jgi:LSD1 subclass zinc finger protein